MDNHLPDVNLLPKHERDPNTLYYIFIGLIIIIILAYGLIGFSYISTNNALKKEQATSTELNEQKELLELTVTQATADDAASTTEMLSFIENHEVLTSDFIDEINELLPEHSYMSDYNYEGQEAEVVSHFENLEDVAEYTTRLTDSDFSNDVKVNSVDTYELKEENEDIFQAMPRYESQFTIHVNQQELKGGEEDDE